MKISKFIKLLDKKTLAEFLIYNQNLKERFITLWDTEIINISNQFDFEIKKFYLEPEWDEYEEEYTSKIKIYLYLENDNDINFILYLKNNLEGN